MPYIGNDLATQFQAFATQTITGDGSTGYTLDRAVANGKELLVYINNVKQEEGSGKAYTASGTTITFSEAVASTDSCYLVYMGSAQQTVTAPDGSIVSGQIANATLALPSGLTAAANTGIGTTSPDGALHVKGISDHGRFILESGGDAGNTNTTFMQFHNNGGTEIAQIQIDEGASNEGQIIFKTGGTTTAMTIDKDGHITKPLQSAFLASIFPATRPTNISVNTTTGLIFGEEIFDQNGDYNASNGKFVAPVTGRYQFNFMGYLQDVPNDASYLYLQLVTSNRNYITIFDPRGFDTSVAYERANINMLVDMDANDEASIAFYQGGGSATTDFASGTSSDPNTNFSGYLVA